MHLEFVVSIAPARHAALAVLRRVREREAFGPETLDAVLRAAGLNARDTALATRLTYGTLQTLGTLDEAIDRFADRPAQIEPSVRDALRLATYELLFMRTPARAAVHEGVDAVRSVRAQASGLANAILRRVAAQVDTFPWGDPETDDDALARATGHPRWLVDRWVAELGRERAIETLRADLEPAPLYLWANPFKASRVETMDVLISDGAEPVDDIPPGCIRVGQPHLAVRGRAVAEGFVLVTDAAAQLAPRACGSSPGGIVVDVAAGRGTKTALLQAACVEAGAPSRLYALDIHAFKAGVLTRRMRDLGVPDVIPVVGDATDLGSVADLPAAGSADSVLLDAPCSGLGSLRRRPEKRWRVSPEDVDRLAVLQAAMLESAASLVRVGGRVVYSTCTVSRRENHDVVEAFLERAAGSFRTADITPVVPEAWSDDITDEGWFQSTPRSGGPDGHFVAVLERVQ
jgi:16S rRNA (cytosine967-C5)-methyltransferase